VALQRFVRDNATLNINVYNKTSKYSQLAQTYIFMPIAVETLGPMNKAGFQFLSELGRRISQESGDHCESAFISATVNNSSTF